MLSFFFYCFGVYGDLHSSKVMQYYYVDSQGKTAGPVDEEKLRAMHQNEEITSETEVAAVGSSVWTSCGETFTENAETERLSQAPPSDIDSNLLSPSQLSGVEKGTVAKVPLATPQGSLRCHDIDYKLIGDDLQLVEVQLDSGETVIAEVGVLNYMESGIVFEAKMGDGSKLDQGLFSKLMDAGKRKFASESIFLTHFRNESSEKKLVAFAAPYPGKIVCLNMAELEEEVFCQKDSFLCAALGTEVSIAFQKRLGTGFFGGEGFILQRLKGDGMVFAHAGGTVVMKVLKGETLRVDTGCLVAFTKGIEYDFEKAGNLKSMFFGGEGMFLATLRGHGSVWLQSMPFSRLADRVLPHVASSRGKA